MTATVVTAATAGQSSRRERPASAIAPTANPSWNTTQVMRITPPTRASPAIGPATCEMPRLASGTPPNGKEKRTASTREWAAGRPITRHRPFGAASSARPWRQAKIRLAAR